MRRRTAWQRSARPPLPRIALAVVVAVAALAGATPSPASAASEWTRVQQLSAPRANNGELPQVAIADDGTAIAVWRYLDGVTGHHRVQFAIRAAGQTFFSVPSTPAQVPATYLSDTTHEVRPWIRLKMNKRGDAIVVWEDVEDNGKVGIRSAYKPFDGSFGPEQVVRNEPGDPDFKHSLVEPEVGIDGQGVATAMYHRPPSGAFGAGTTSDSTYFVKSRPAGAASTWDSDANEQEAVPHDYGNETDPIKFTETHASLSVNEAGDRFAAFASQKDHNGSIERQVVKIAERDHGDATWFERGEDDTPTSSPDEEVTATYIQVREQVQVVANGNVIWSEGSSLYTEPHNGINSPFGAPANGSGAALRIVDSTTNALALWSDGQGLRAASATPFNNPFDAPDGDPVAGNSPDVTRTRPALTDAGGPAFAVFQQQDGSDSTVQVAQRPAGGTTKFDTPMTVRQADGSAKSGAPIALSEPGDLESDTPADNPPKAGTGPTVAVSANGEAVAAWSRFDGETFRTEVSLFVPQQVSTGGGGVPAGQPIPTPPPPAPPPPEVESPIQLARPQKRDMATVLVANVPDDTRQLQWSFGSTDEPPIVGDVVDGKLQRSVRLRLPGTSFTATLRIVGPNGTRTVSRSLGSFQPSSTQDSKAVQHGLARADTPPVFAVGQTDVLTGNQTRTRAGQGSSCAPTSVWSGQQKMTGCLRPIEGLVDIPNLERGAIHELASQLHLDETRADLMQKATQLTDGYVAQGKALLNDTFPVTPEQASQLVNIPQAKALVSARAELPVGSATYDPKNGFNLKVDPKQVKIPLGPLPKPPKLPSLGGLEIVGTWDVDLDKREAKIKASLKLPQEITKAGVRFDNSIELRATPDRVIVDRASIGPIDVDIGALNVKAFKISYDRALDEWDGQAQACAIVAVCISMAPPDGHITLSHGRVTFAGASVRFPPPGIELFPGIDLSKIGFGMGFDPTRLIGSGQISAVEIIGLDGKFLLAFPSSRAPFILRRDEVGNDFAPDLYGQSFTRTTIGMAGGASFMIPETDESLEFAKAYLLYEYPGYIALGGGGHIDIVGIIQLDGNLSAAMDIPAKRFNIHGDVSACWFESNDICGKAVANVSHGPHKEGGAGACISIGPVSIGGGVQWARVSDPFLWPLDGCKWSRFAIDVRPSAARAGHAASLYNLTVRQGEPSPALKFYGKGGAPLVRVSGPGGQVLDGTSSKRIDLSPGGKIRIIRFEGNKFAGPATVVGLENVQPGRYTVEALPGSPPIIGSAHAFDQPDAKVSGKVVGTGRHRVLLYNVLPRNDQKVTFQELEPGGPAKTIGTITGGGRGQIRFNSAPGRGVRRVIAQFELASLPAERKLIATFRPQSPRIGKPHRITVRRKGGSVFVSWRPVAGATRYEVAARLSNLRTIFKSTARTRIRLRIARWFSGRVTVRAIDDLRLSDVGHGLHGFRAISSPPSGFRPLLNCRVTKRSIGCARPRRRSSRPRSL